MNFREEHPFMVALMVILGLFGCGDPEISPEERLAGSTAYDSLLTSLPDSVRLSRIDSLFLNYRGDFTPVGVPDSAEVRGWVESTMAGMTLDEKIGQLFIVHLSTDDYTALSNEAVRTVRRHRPGGFLVPRLLEPREVFDEMQRLQKESRIPLFIAADYERGVGRFNNALTELPSNMAIGATRDTMFAAAAGRLTAIEARSVGVNLLFAPVVDVNNNPDNPIINIRSYGEDPELVGRMAAAFVREAQEYGLLTTLKHFPGHGNTSVDTHSKMGTIGGTRADLDRVELHPYRTVMAAARPAAVMSAHLWIKALEDEPIPATFSKDVLGGLLRNELGFDGVVITDDIRMGALQFEYDTAQRILRPILAGADVILTPADVGEAINVLRQAVDDGRLTVERLDESVRRILTAKASAALHLERYADEARLNHLMDEPLGAYIAQEIADHSITVLKTTDNLPLDAQRIAVVHLTNFRGSESIPAAMDLIDETLKPAESVRFEGDPTARQLSNAVAKTEEADVVILALYLRLQAGRGEAGLFEGQTRLVNELLKGRVPVVLVTFGNPYAASTFSDADAILVAYDQSLQTAYAAARVLKGEQPAQGRLPITVEPFEFGSGLEGVGR
ncbi:MAG: glycoside hydrolase family 3 N-terminal domain-containing protein [Rhodothermales bacterium]